MTVMTDVSRSTDLKQTKAIEAHDARDLIKNGVQTCITLDGQIYFLRITRAGKLILTK